MTANNTRMCSVYEAADKLYIQAKSKTRDGFWISDGVVDVLAIGVERDELGRAIQACAARSRTGLEQPKSWKALTQQLLRAAKQRSWRAFASGTKLITVSVEMEEVSFVPSRNLGPSEGFESNYDLKIVLDVGRSAQEWGESAANALRLSTSGA